MEGGKIAEICLPRFHPSVFIFYRTEEWKAGRLGDTFSTFPFFSVNLLGGGSMEGRKVGKMGLPLFHSSALPPSFQP